MKSDIGISPEAHREYIEYHNQVDTGNLEPEEVIKEAKSLFSSKTLIEDKKRILFSLAHHR